MRYLFMTEPQMRYLAIWRGSYYYIISMNLTGSTVMLKPMVTPKSGLFRRSCRYKWKSLITRKFVRISRDTEVSVFNPDTNKYEVYEAY